MRNGIIIGVRWEPPSRGHYKLNTDGATIGNRGISDIGVVFRTSSRDWIPRYLENMPYTTNTLAELTALLRELQIAQQRDLTPLEIATDST